MSTKAKLFVLPMFAEPYFPLFEDTGSNFDLDWLLMTPFPPKGFSR